MYCVYFTIYFGQKLPKRYIGSCKLENISKGYNGSVSSKKYQYIYELEQKKNKHLFKTRILSLHKTDKEARQKERDLQVKYNVVKSTKYINESLAQPDGYFGRDVSGKNNPMYGKSRKGEKHKGGENISKGLKNFFKTEKGMKERQNRSQRCKGIGNPMYNKSHSDEERKRRSIIYSGEGNPMYGKTHSKVSRLKISKSKKGIPSPMKGKSISEEQKEKLRKPKTEKHKQKLRKTYIINDYYIVNNAKEYCEKNNLNYVLFTQAAKKGKRYKDLDIKVMET